MAAYNHVTLIGNLTRDPELTYTPTQVAVCKFGLAVNKKYKAKNGEDREDTLFVDCTAFDRKGELIHQYVKKGNSLLVVGSLKMDSWDDKTTGQKRQKLYVIVGEMQFLGGKGNGEAASPASSKVRPVAKSQPVPDEDAVEFRSEDIPF